MKPRNELNSLLNIVFKIIVFFMSSQMLNILFILMIRNLCWENPFIYLRVAYVFQPHFDDDFFSKNIYSIAC